MTIEHVVKIGAFIVPVVAVRQDGSLIVAFGSKQARYILAQWKLIFTRKNGRIASMIIHKHGE